MRVTHIKPSTWADTAETGVIQPSHIAALIHAVALEDADIASIAAALKQAGAVIAGEALGGHRAVVLDASGHAFYASSSNAAHAGRLAGITTGAAEVGSAVVLVSAGLLVEPSWSWTPGQPVFLGTGGMLTQTQPLEGFVQIIGMPSSPTSLFIHIRELIALF